eukprot:3720797-Rhodomonas_salina.4
MLSFPSGRRQAGTHTLHSRSRSRHCLRRIKTREKNKETRSATLSYCARCALAPGESCPELNGVCDQLAWWLSTMGWRLAQLMCGVVCGVARSQSVGSRATAKGS